MAAIALDPHQLVRLDSKSTPRARSFREWVRGALLCVSDACALDALEHFFLTMMPPPRSRIRSSAKTMFAATHRLPLSLRPLRRKGEGTMITCGRHHRARATAFSRAPQRFVGICRSTSTLLEVSRTTCWRQQGQSTSRERRMAMLAGARSLHARPWERRYRHAFGGWFERGRLNLRAGEGPFLRDRREVTG